MVLFRLAGAHNSVGAAAQWLRQDGPITRTTRGGAEALTVIDSFATARTVYILATTTLFNTQETLKKADVKHWFRCRYAANDTRPATRASVNPAHSPTTTSMVLVECDLPRQCFDGAMALEAVGPARVIVTGVAVARAPACAAAAVPEGEGAMAFCLAPVFGSNLNGALLIEWLEYHLGLGFDRIHFYDTAGPEAQNDTKAILAHYVQTGAVVAHDWSPARHPGPLWPQGSSRSGSFMYAQSLALYDCFLSRVWAECFLLRGSSFDSISIAPPKVELIARWFARRRERISETSDWMFYGDIDEVVVAPFVERRNLTSLKALMATLPSATKYFIRSSLITMFERTAAGAMARARLILSAVDERATTSVPGGPTKAHTKWCARTRGLGPLHPIFLSVHSLIGSVGAPATQPPRDWPMSSATRATPALFYQNHYMVNPPRKAEMARGAPIMRQIRFKKVTAKDLLSPTAAAAAEKAVTGLPPHLTRIYDCWRDRLHSGHFASATTHNLFFAVDGGAPCAALAAARPPWRRSSVGS